MVAIPLTAKVLRTAIHIGFVPTWSRHMGSARSQAVGWSTFLDVYRLFSGFFHDIWKSPEVVPESTTSALSSTQWLQLRSVKRNGLAVADTSASCRPVLKLHASTQIYSLLLRLRRHMLMIAILCSPFQEFVLTWSICGTCV